MRKIVLFFVMSVLWMGLFGQTDQVSTFAHLKELKLSNGYKVFYPEAGTIVFNTLVTQLPSSDPFHSNGEGEDGGNIKILRMKLGPSDAESLTVLYTDGPSADPAFIFANNNGDIIEILGGTELYLPGTGSIYISGHTNTAFNMRRKFNYKDGAFTEVKQAYYYVGLKTVTTREVTLTTQMGGGEAVAVLPANSEVEVLLALFQPSTGDFEYFLLKTPFGLTGWYGIKTYMLGEEPPIKGIYWAGD